MDDVGVFEVAPGRNEWEQQMLDIAADRGVLAACRNAAAQAHEDEADRLGKQLCVTRERELLAAAEADKLRAENDRLIEQAKADNEAYVADSEAYVEENERIRAAWLAQMGRAHWLRMALIGVTYLRGRRAMRNAAQTALDRDEARRQS